MSRLFGVLLQKSGQQPAILVIVHPGFSQPDPGTFSIVDVES